MAVVLPEVPGHAGEWARLGPQSADELGIGPPPSHPCPAPEVEAGTTTPGQPSGSCLRIQRWIATSCAVQPSHRVGASAGTALRTSQNRCSWRSRSSALMTPTLATGASRQPLTADHTRSVAIPPSTLSSVPVVEAASGLAR